MKEERSTEKQPNHERLTNDDKRMAEKFVLQAIATRNKCALEYEEAYTRALSVSSDTQLRHIAIAREQCYGSLRRFILVDSILLSSILARNWTADEMIRAIFDAWVDANENDDETTDDV